MAIRRARTPASSWRDHDWRLVHDEPQDPAVLRRQTQLSRAEITGTLTEYFRQQHGPALGGLATGELRAARELARTKFTTREWTARVP